MSLRAIVFLAVATLAHADVAISIRYFKVEGASHHHLFLYGDDGKLIRQLTAPEDAQDTAPTFSPDGREIAFTREQRGTKRVFLVDPDGGKVHAMADPPAWYTRQEHAEHFVNTGGGTNDLLWQARNQDYFIKSPDGKQELVLKSADNFKHLDSSFSAICFKALTIRDVASGKENRVSTTGNELDNYCDLMTRKQSPFLMTSGMSMAFYWQWQGSTTGPRLGVIDLAGERAVFLSQNPAIVVPHGTRPGFFCVCQERYQPLGDAKRTVNCLYLDWWNASLQRTRFAKAISLFGGASVRVKDQPQIQIPVNGNW